MLRASTKCDLISTLRSEPLLVIYIYIYIDANNYILESTTMQVQQFHCIAILIMEIGLVDPDCRDVQARESACAQLTWIRKYWSLIKLDTIIPAVGTIEYKKHGHKQKYFPLVKLDK